MKQQTPVTIILEIVRTVVMTVRRGMRVMRGGGEGNGVGGRWEERDGYGGIWGEGGAVHTEHAGRYYYKGDPLGRPKYLAHLCAQGP